MGRKAGVSAEQTRSELLEAAARVFALKGYEGSTISDITNEAGLSAGAIYAHYDGKAELFVAAVRAHARRDFTTLLSPTQFQDSQTPPRDMDVADFVAMAGSSFGRAEPAAGALMIEAIVAATRNPEVAEMVMTWLLDGESLLAGALGQAQAQGILDDRLGSAAMSRLITMVALGARLAIALELPTVDPREWTELIERLVDSTRK